MGEGNPSACRLRYRWQLEVMDTDSNVSGMFEWHSSSLRTSMECTSVAQDVHRIVDVFGHAVITASGSMEERGSGLAGKEPIRPVHIRCSMHRHMLVAVR
jgi:hypothetical protein